MRHRAWRGDPALTLVLSARLAYGDRVETTPASEPSETRTAKDYYRDHRDKVMVICGKEGQAPASRDFFLVESVGTLAGGLLITGLFDHARRERLRSHSVRLATEGEIASRNGGRGPSDIG